MNRKIDLIKTCIALRELPPEIKFSQVEEWVHGHQPALLKPNTFLHSWLHQWKFWN